MRVAQKFNMLLTILMNVNNCTFAGSIVGKAQLHKPVSLTFVHIENLVVSSTFSKANSLVNGKIIMHIGDEMQHNDFSCADSVWIFIASA